MRAINFCAGFILLLSIFPGYLIFDNLLYERELATWRDTVNNKYHITPPDQIADQYDVVIIGSGLAGSMTGLTLSKNGIKTLVIEKGTHPRFTIGESTTPSTSLGLTELGKNWGVPELETMAHYLGLKKIDCPGYPKQTFWFGYHYENEDMQLKRELQLDTFQLPLGPDLHMKRACVDQFLVSRFPKYAVDYLEYYDVVDFVPKNDNQKMSILTINSSKTGVVLKVKTHLIVDATGHSSYFGNRYNLIEKPSSFKTSTRVLYGHFRNIPPLEDIIPQGPNRNHHFKRHGGTMHHMFRGGWIWGIPFDDNVTSVGMLLHIDEYPHNFSMTADQEFDAVIAKFPTLVKHLGNRVLVTPEKGMHRSPGRIQFSTTTNVVPELGLLFTPHASGFIDPLFSTGITFTGNFIARFIKICHMMKYELNNWDITEFKPFLENKWRKEKDAVDLIVDGNVKSLYSWELFKQYWRTWAQVSSMQYIAKMFQRHDIIPNTVDLYSGDVNRWRELLDETHKIMDDFYTRIKTNATLKNFSDQHCGDHQQSNAYSSAEEKTLCQEIEVVAAAIKEKMDSVANQYYGSQWEIYSDKAPSTFVNNITAMHRWMEWAVYNHEEFARDFDRWRIIRFYLLNIRDMGLLYVRYYLSKLVGGQYYKSIDFIETMRQEGYNDFYYIIPSVADLWARITNQKPAPLTIDSVHLCDKHF